MINLEENFKWHLEAFAFELFIYYPMRPQEKSHNNDLYQTWF